MNMFMQKIHFISLGCPKNQVDSEVMLGFLAKAGFSFTDDPNQAEIIIINTCAFIDDAKKEAIDTILEMAEFKKQGTCRLLVVTGCLSQRYAKDLMKSLAEVDLFIGTGEFPKLADLINKFEKQTTIVNKPLYLYDHTTPRIRTTPNHLAYIKISEGCFHPCSFCVIPKIRGKYRSRKMDSIIAEAEKMLENGVRELNLIGQDTTAYGRDLDEDTNLATLLEGLADLAGDKWIRIFYTYPHNFPDQLVTVIKSFPEVCDYLDIPIQHISNRILKDMQRQSSKDEIRRLIDKLRIHIPDISLRTSLIAGFPGETDEEFEELLDFVSEAKFNHLGVFPYSKEEGTLAAKLPNQVPAEVAQERCNEIMKLQHEIAFDNNRSFLGNATQVLIDERLEDGQLIGRHQGQAPEIDGQVIVQGNAKPGDFVLVKITEFDAYDLQGNIISAASVLRGNSNL
ncbi:MAG: 30S ribosomal protein S12 methylthiotransferase RimO [Pseudomonadota bacterium]